MKQDVLVVGAGPVGLTMAAELARYGVGVRIIDKAAQRTDKSKALVLWSRSLELIERMGCAPSFVAAGRQVRSASIVGGGKRITHISFDGLQTPYPYALMLPQSETERLMEQHLNGCGVQVERQVELIRFDSGPDGLRASLRHADGREEMIDAGWMIGCDGAHSLVRHGLGMQFEGETLPSNWILADVHLMGVPGGADEIAAYWHADGPIVLFPISPGRYRVVADVGETKAGERPDDPTLAEVQAVLDQRGPGGITASEPVWLASFVINDRKVADYRSGRVFLAGDAAHIHSPAGGQGMNTGMQDACNLGWKLALVSRGLAAAEPLLASYSSERSEIAQGAAGCRQSDDDRDAEEWAVAGDTQSHGVAVVRPVAGAAGDDRGDGGVVDRLSGWSLDPNGRTTAWRPGGGVSAWWRRATSDRWVPATSLGSRCSGQPGPAAPSCSLAMRICWSRISERHWGRAGFGWCGPMAMWR